MNKLFYFLLIVENILAFPNFNFDAKLQEKFNCPANCVDIWGDCQQVVQYCQDPKKGSVIRSKCSCTCQVCNLPAIPTTTPSMDQYKCRPVNLIFVLDTSQSIDGDFFNNSVRAFVKKIASVYPMKGEISGLSSRIGVVQFASSATVTYPLIERSRVEFENTIDQGVFYSDEGITRISLGLDAAVDEFINKGVAKNNNVMVILVTDGVSTLDIRQTQVSANKVRDYTQYFGGVGIDGINGNDISANLTNLVQLIGNEALAFADMQHAEDSVKGIWPESRQIYPCLV